MLKHLALALFLTAVALRAQFVPDVVSYVDVTPAAHQLQFTTLSSQGYRPISLCVAGGMATARYSAVWIRRSGATFVGVHGVDAAGYETWRTQQRSAGYRPLLVTTAGNTNDTVYAGIYVRDGVQATERIEIAGLDSYNATAYTNDDLLTCASVRGVSTRYFAAIWEENPDEDAWCWDISAAADYSADFNAHVDGYGRLVSAMTLPSGDIAQIWRDSSTGGFVALPNLTSAQILAEISSRRPSGWYPTNIQQRGTGSSARFHVVFAPRDQPYPRVFSRTGTAVIPLAAFDDYMEAHVRAHGIRQSAIAITKDGRLVYARGYTFAEAGQTLTQPTTMFRVASLSKTVTGLGINLLFQRGGTITQGTHVASYLGLSSGIANFSSITMLQLLEHRAGLASDNDSWSVANLLYPSSPTLPINSWQTALAIARTPLIYVPGQDNQYSNLGFYLLGSTIEQASGKTYERFIREDLGAPHGITRLWVGRDERSQLRSGEAEPRNRFLDITPSELYTDRRTVPIQFGGEGDDNLARRAGAGGVLTSPVDYVRLFAGAFDLACDGGIFTQATVNTMLGAPNAQGGANPCGFDSRDVRPNGVIAFGKNGALWGSSTQFIYRNDGVAIAVFDGYQNSHANRDTLNNLADAVTSWPTIDLFPNYGLPSFNRVCPRIYNLGVSTLPNVTEDAFVVNGDVLSGVDRVVFNGTSITSQASTTLIGGWFRIVSDNQIEIHPPQGLAPGTYPVRLYNGLIGSDSFDVTLTRATTRTLLAPGVAFGGFELILSRGASSSQSDVLLCYSTSNTPSSLPGIVNLDIGAGFRNLWTWPTTNRFNFFTGTTSWSVPDIGPAQLYFQALVVDPNSIYPLPAPVSNVRSLRSF